MPRLHLRSLLAPTLGSALVLLASCGSSGGSGTPSQTALTEIRFQTRQEIATGLRALRAMRAVDLTNDGVLDIVVTAIDDKQVRVLVGSSSVSWSTSAGFRASYATAPTELAIADFDNDGDRDFCVLFDIEGVVRVYRNDGTGNFTEDAATLPVGGNPAGLVAADFDQSGAADIAICGRGGAELLLFPSRGATGFLDPQVLPTPANSDLASLWIGDLNADARADLVASDVAGNRVHIWLQGQAGFAAADRQALSVGGNGPVSVLGSDVNADGIVDLVTANFGSRDLSLLLGTGNAGFGQPEKLPLDGSPIHLCAADLFGAGRPDLLVSYVDRASIGILRNLGQSKFADETQFGTSGLPTMCQVVDLDGDGSSDVLTSGLDSEFLSWLRGSATGLLGSENFGPGGVAPQFTITSDYDRDGKADLLVADADGGLCHILRGQEREPTGGFEVVGAVPVGAGPHVLSKGDLDNDGVEDAVVAVDGGVRFLINRSSVGSLSFEVRPAVTTPPFGGGIGPFEVAVASLDSDGLADLVVADFGGDRLVMFRGTGSGVGFEPLGQPITVAGGPLGLVTGDFNADGSTDVAVSRLRGGVVTVLAGNGAGQMTELAELTAGTSPNYLRAADFDGNGYSDLVVSNLAGESITVFTASAAGFAGSEVRVGKGPTALLARDLNRDGNPDVLVANAESADFHVLLGDGRGGFPAVQRFPGTWRAVSADLGDTNGDGLEDLVVGSLFTNRISLYVNRSR